ncbi:hypothetical protein ACTXT7_017424 [Hymenolepis weldensis]
MALRSILVFFLVCAIALSMPVQSHPTNKSITTVGTVPTTSKFSPIISTAAHSSERKMTTEIRTTTTPATTEVADSPYILNCEFYSISCCCDCWSGHCLRPQHCGICYVEYYLEEQVIREFIQTMPWISFNLVNLLGHQRPELIKFIFENHEDVKSLIRAANSYTLVHFMNTVDNFGEILSKFERRFIESIFIQISNPCEYFLSLPKRVRDVLAIKRGLNSSQMHICDQRTFLYPVTILLEAKAFDKAANLRHIKDIRINCAEISKINEKVDMDTNRKREVTNMAPYENFGMRVAIRQQRFKDKNGKECHYYQMEVSSPPFSNSEPQSWLSGLRIKRKREVEKQGNLMTLSRRRRLVVIQL